MTSRVNTTPTTITPTRAAPTRTRRRYGSVTSIDLIACSDRTTACCSRSRIRPSNDRIPAGYNANDFIRAIKRQTTDSRSARISYPSTYRYRSWVCYSHQWTARCGSKGVRQSSRTRYWGDVVISSTEVNVVLLVRAHRNQVKSTACLPVPDASGYTVKGVGIVGVDPPTDFLWIASTKPDLVAIIIPARSRVVSYFAVNSRLERYFDYWHYSTGCDLWSKSSFFCEEADEPK